MRTLVTLKNSSKTVKVEIELDVNSILEMIDKKIHLELVNDEIISEYRDSKYYITGIEDID